MARKKVEDEFYSQILNFPKPFILKSGGYSFQDFLKISSEKGKWEILEGTVVMHSLASFEHEMIVINIASELKRKLGNLGRVFGSNAVYRFGGKTGLAPDVSFVKKEHLHLIRKSYFQGPPDIAVEVISPSTQSYDLQEKLPIYKKAKVPLIIYVFPEEKKVVVWERTKSTKKTGSEYTEKIYFAKRKTSLKVFGVKIDISEFFSK